MSNPSYTPKTISKKRTVQGLTGKEKRVLSGLNFNSMIHFIFANTPFEKVLAREGFVGISLLYVYCTECNMQHATINNVVT